MNTQDDLAALMHMQPPGAWPKETVWRVFCYILDKASPLPLTSTVMDQYAGIFFDVFEKIAKEHAKVYWRYYRDDDLNPLVNPLNLEHLTRLLHPFANRIYQKGAPEALLDCLFYLMKAHCNINLFYRTEEIDDFYPLHALGSVIGYGDFGPFIVVTQQCTIGQNGGKYPSIEGGLWMCPNSVILGKCRIGRNVKLAANSMVVDQDVPDNTIVFGVARDVYFKPNPSDNRSALLDAFEGKRNADPIRN